jgi:hypothetical protein
LETEGVRGTIAKGLRPSDEQQFVVVGSGRCRTERQHAGAVIRSNDSKCGVAMTVSAAKVVRNFFMSLLLWLRFHGRRLQNALDYSSQSNANASF